MTDDHATRLIDLACQWVCRVHEIDPERNGTWLQSLSEQDRWELLFVLAAMVDPNSPLSKTLRWLEGLAPHDA